MKKLLGQTDSIKVSEITDDNGITTREVAIKISDTTTMTGYYVNNFVDVEAYKRNKQMNKRK